MADKLQDWRQMPLTSIDDVISGAAAPGNVKVTGIPTSVVTFTAVQMGEVGLRLDHRLYCALGNSSELLGDYHDCGELATAVQEAKESGQAIVVGFKYDPKNSRAPQIKYVKAEAQNLEKAF